MKHLGAGYKPTPAPEQAKQVNFFPRDVDLAQAKRLWQVVKINATVSQCYQPQLYQGSIRLFQATERPDELLAEPDYGWKDYATEGVEIIPIPGNHHNLVKSPPVQVLAEQLERYLM